MVECEYFLQNVSFTQSCVLIDTWWNVNLNDPSNKITSKSVLIDTWWNVNVFKSKRNIRRNVVLIDTWWNVNLKHGDENTCYEEF